MGSWYNIDAATDAARKCIDNLCGPPPANPSDTASMVKWRNCADACNVSKLGTGSVSVDLRPNQTNTVTPTPAERQNGGSTGLSTNMKIGLFVGAVAIAGIWWLSRKK